MNKYKKPIINVTRFDAENIVTVSGGEYNFTSTPTYKGVETAWKDVVRSKAVGNVLKLN